MSTGFDTDRPRSTSLSRPRRTRRRWRPLGVFLAPVATVGVVGLSVGAIALASADGALPAPGDAAQAAAGQLDQVQTVAAEADAWISAQHPRRNFGAGTSGRLRGARESGLLRFAVPVPVGRRVTSATLHLTGRNAAAVPISLFSSTGAWSEAAVTWVTAPAGRVLIGTGVGDAGGRFSWNVTTAVPAAGGTVGFRIESPTAARVTVFSRERGAPVAPSLEITTAPSSGAAATTQAPLTGPTWTSPPPIAPATGSTQAGQSSTDPAARGARPNAAAQAAAEPDWTEVYRDDFNGTSLSDDWTKYAGAIPSMPKGTWKPSQVQVSDGMLHLSNSKSDGAWTSGGVMNSSSARTTYGKYEVRFRVPAANGVKYTFLLWPVSGHWPDDGEIDFAEDPGGNRGGTAGTLHWGTSSAPQQEQYTVSSDFSSWHTVGVEWTPGEVDYTLDGRVWKTVDTPHVPTRAMNLGLQTEAGSCWQWMTCADATTPAVTTLDVDWVAVYTHS